MSILIWIIGSTLAMSCFAWIGLITLAFKEHMLKTILLPLVAFAAGSLIGASFLHLIPETMARTGPRWEVFLWLLLGFSVFLLMEQFLSWHHHHVVPSEHKEPFTYLILFADGLHNFIAGVAIGASFLVSVKVGLITWIAAAAHEIPQELGDFGILIRGGWNKKRALLFNFLSALLVVPGGILAYFLSGGFDTTFLLPFAAGNFIYIAASDLIPEIKHHASLRKNLEHFCAFGAGILVIVLTRLLFTD